MTPGDHVHLTLNSKLTGTDTRTSVSVHHFSRVPRKTLQTSTHLLGTNLHAAVTHIVWFLSLVVRKFPPGL